MNSERHKLRIYGLLTNLTRFYFYSYDPIKNKFYVDEKMFLDLSRLPFISGTIGGTYFTWCKSLKAHVYH